MKNRRTLITLVFALLILSGCVKSSSQVVLQKISFASETLTVVLNAPANTQLTPVFTPAVFSSIPVTWSSTDDNVVTVSNGWIIPHKAGTAWIKIKDQNSATTGKCLIVVQ